MLARELGEEPKDVLIRAQRLGIPVTTVLHSLDPGESSRILDSFTGVREGGGTQVDSDRGPYGGSSLAEEHDPVTAVTIISVAGEGTAPGDSEAPTGQPQESVSVVEDRDDAEFVAIQDEDALDAELSGAGDVGEVEMGDAKTAATAGGEESQALLHVVKDTDGGEGVAPGSDQLDGDFGAAGEVAVAEVEDVAIEQSEDSSLTEAVAVPVEAMPGDPWDIDTVVEEASNSAAEPVVAEPVVAELVGEEPSDAVLVDAQLEGFEPGAEEPVADTPAGVEIAEEADAPLEMASGEPVAEDDDGAPGPVVMVDVDRSREPASEESEDVESDVQETHAVGAAAFLDDPGDGEGADSALQGDGDEGGPVAVDVRYPQPDLETDAIRARTWPWRLGVAVWALLIVAVAVGGAVLTTNLMSQGERAESDVIVRLSGFDSAEIDRQVGSYVVAAESQTVVGPAAAAIGITEAELRDAMSVGLVADSAVLRFAVEDEDGSTALTSTQAVVEQYLLVVNAPFDDTRVAFVDEEIARVEESLTSISPSLSTLSSRRSDNAARRAGLIAVQETLRGRLIALFATRSEITSGVAVPGTSLAGLQADIDVLEAQLDEVSEELEQIEATDSADALAEAQLLSQQASLQDELARLRDRRVGLGIDQLDESRARASVLTPPYLLEQSLVPSAARGAAFGLAVGLILAVLFVVLVSWLRRRQ